MIPWINMGEKPKWLRLEVVVEKYRAPGSQCWFIGQLCLRNGGGSYSDRLAVFWQEKPAQPRFSNYFAIYRQSGSLMITDAISV
ncbi:MAG: hypothetical protein EOO77_38515, partial [Oxalobacteraceae bacterium]